MFELGSSRIVFSGHRPVVVVHNYGSIARFSYDRLNSKNHVLLDQFIGIMIVVQNLRIFMQIRPYSVTAKLSDNSHVELSSKAFNRFANGAYFSTNAANLDGLVQRELGNVDLGNNHQLVARHTNKAKTHQMLSICIDAPHRESVTTISMEAIIINTDIDGNDITVLQPPSIGNGMDNNVVD